MSLESASLNLDVDCSIPQIKEQLTQFPVSMEIYNLLHRKESERARYSGHKYRRGVQRILKSLLNKLNTNAGAKRARVDPRSKTNGGDGRARVDPRSKTNGGDGRVDPRSKTNGGDGRVDPRSKTNGGDGRVDLRSKTNRGDGRVDPRSKTNGGDGRVDPRSKTNGGDGRVDPRSKTNGGDGRVDQRNQVRGGQRRQTKTKSESESRRAEPDLHGLRDFWWHHWQDAALVASCCASHEAAVHTFWSDEEFLVNLHAATTGSISIVRNTLSVLDRISEHMYHTRIIY